MNLFDMQTHQLEVMLAENQMNARAKELGIQARDYRRMIRRMERRRRAELCRNAEVILFFASGSGATFGLAAHEFGAGMLPTLCAFALAGVTAAVGFWCDKWSRT